MRYTLLQIAAAANIPYSSMCRHIKMLEQEKKFVKKTPGKKYNQGEVKQLEEIFDFQFITQK